MLFLGFLAYAEAASLLLSLSNVQRVTLLAINTAAAGVILLLARRPRVPDKSRESAYSPRWSAAPSAIRDWLPCFLIILAYRESAMFSAPQPLHPLNGIFERWDLGLLANAGVRSFQAAASPWLNDYLELAYLLCYPVVPLGFAVVYLHSRGLGVQTAERMLDRFWTGVLLALLTCYALFPLFPLMTPRLLFRDLAAADSHSALHRLNLWLLGHFAGAGGVFPSGHVAGATAIALSVWKQSRGWGAAFIIVAASIALATVTERYHYTADVVAGMLIAAGAVSAAGLLRHQPNRDPHP
jgi:membrane-associated phospholipid phosphatase